MATVREIPITDNQSKQCLPKALKAFLQASPFVLIHGVLLMAVSWESLSLLRETRFVDAIFFMLSNLQELVFLGAIYFLLAALAPKRASALSTAFLLFLVTLTSLYFLVTVKTRVVYGGSYLLDELLPFVVYYGPSYITFLSLSSAVLALGGLVLLPHLLSFLAGRQRIARAALLASSLTFICLGTLGWFTPVPAGLPEYLRHGPLQLLALASIRESAYRERTSARLAEVDALLDSSLEATVVESPEPLPGLNPVKKVVLYQMEGVPQMIFRPDSAYADLLPRLSEWSDHALQLTNHYTLSTLTFHSYQAISIGGYIRSGSRLETVGIDSASLVRPLVEEGFETGFFSAADLYYRGTVKFLNGLGFETVTHFGDYAGTYASNGKLIDDRALIASFRQWSEGKTRFFAVINPMGTHHPYWNPEGDAVGDLGGSAELRRYLNAVHYQDKILGELIDYVDREHPDALLVVLSDHGIREYFAELEESVPPYQGFAASFETRFHVPLFFYNRRAFPEATRYDLPTSHIDVMPTVLHLMGLEVADRPLGGTNLCSHQPRVRFLNTQHNLDVLALLDGRYKFLLERETGAARLFELAGERSVEEDRPQGSPRTGRAL